MLTYKRWQDQVYDQVNKETSKLDDDSKLDDLVN